MLTLYVSVLLYQMTQASTYVNTGDKRKDDETYAAKKAQWIEQNSAKYEQMSTSSNKEDAEAIRAKERKEFINQKLSDEKITIQSRGSSRSLVLHSILKHNVRKITFKSEQVVAPLGQRIGLHCPPVCMEVSTES